MDAAAGTDARLRAGLVYLAIVGLDVVGISVVLGPTELSIGASLIWLPLAALLLLPSIPITLWLVGRMSSRSILGRSVAGGLAWAGWAVYVGTNLAVLSHVVLVADRLGVPLAVLLISGAAFSVLGFGAVPPRPGRALTLAGLAVAAAVVVGSILMSGRWGGPT